MSNSIPTVYIVDDDISLCKALRWLIESIKLKVETFNEAKKFLEAYNSDWKGCILIDVRMPEISGLQLHEKLISINNQLPVVMISGHGDIAMAVRALKAGALDFITKPFNEQVLIDTIQYALSINKQQKSQKDKQVEERYQKLTEREKAVMIRVVAGKMNKVIADELNISSKTVELHRSHVMQKMEARNLAELIKMHLLSNLEDYETHKN